MAVETTIQVVMPKMGDSVAEGKVLGWRKAEGDRVAADETIVDISTDKVDAEVVAPASGTLVKVHAAEGDSVSVGAVLAEIVPTNGSTPSQPSSRPQPREANRRRRRSSTSSPRKPASRSAKARSSPGRSR